MVGWVGMRRVGESYRKGGGELVEERVNLKTKQKASSQPEREKDAAHNTLEPLVASLFYALE